MNHPARVGITGHFNPCYGWDYPPASYVAVTMISLNVYFSFRYAWLESTRVNMVAASKKQGIQSFGDRFSTITAYNLALASCFTLLLWLIGPNDGNWLIHTMIFVYYAISSYLAALGNYLEAASGPWKHMIETKHRVYIVTYGLSLASLAVVYPTNTFVVDVAPALFQIADAVWLIHMLVEQKFAPPQPPMRITVELVLGEEAESLASKPRAMV